MVNTRSGSKQQVDQENPPHDGNGNQRDDQNDDQPRDENVDRLRGENDGSQHGENIDPPLSENANGNVQNTVFTENHTREQSGFSNLATGSAARLRLQLQIEAQERLADIRRKELQLEAELVKQKLALELETLGFIEKISVSDTNERENNWLRTNTENQQPVVTSSGPAADLVERAQEAATSHQVLTPQAVRGEPLNVNTAQNYDVRQTRDDRIVYPKVIPKEPTYQDRREELEEDDYDRRAERKLDSRYEYEQGRTLATERSRRSRSPTPTRGRASRGIEQLAEALEKMARDRPPPRQAYDLPTFTGAPSEWLPFKAAMRDSTQLYRFTPAENLARLRVSLKGEARETVATLMHTATSPDVIMQTLEQCYGRPEIIVDRALEDLRRLPKPGLNASELNMFAIKLQNIVAVLKNIDRKGYLHNPLLTREVIDKLSPHLRSKWCDFAYSNDMSTEPEVVLLSRFLMQEADRALRYTYMTAPTSSAETKTRDERSRNMKVGTKRQNEAGASRVYTTAIDEPRKVSETSRQCPCCGGTHAIGTCRKLQNMDVNSRWEWAKAARICFKCLEKQHRRGQCKAPECGTNNCQRPHHKLLHKDVENFESTQSKMSTSPSDKAEAVTSIAATNENKVVLLKVCSVEIAGPAGKMMTYALLDEGSTVSLIDEDLAKKIGASGTPMPLRLRGINTMQKQEDSSRVTIKIRGRRSRIGHEMIARTVKNLDLHQQTVPRDIRQYPHLRHLYEDVCFKNAKPHILLGADNWHLIVSHQLRAGGKNEPAASRTDLGWVVYGTLPRLIKRNEDAVLHVYAVERNRDVIGSAKTDLNVANDATRMNYNMKDSESRWSKGSPLLYASEEDWPQFTKLTEEEGNEFTYHTAAVNQEQWTALPDIKRFSSYERLMRVTATVLAFIDKCRHAADRLQVRHLEQAEKLWLTRAQEESFPEEISCLRAGKPIPATSCIFKLHPMLEEGLLRVRGRIGAAHIPTNTKQPIILDGRHRLSRLIILKEHAAAGHQSNERVVNDLRQRFWITRLRPSVRAVARSCALCKIRRAKPRIPVTGDLPLARIDPYCRPFSNCGIDYFGPMIVTVGRRHEKRWGALFTCLTTRAIHIELVASLTTDSAIMALRRMAARRGWPKVIYSDNGTNFRGADKELRAACHEWEPALRDYAMKHRVDWRFITPGAPNQGGAWERLVRSIKTALNATLKDRAPKDEVLLTLLVEAEYCINARPLTHVSVEPNDPEALTPNHFLIGSSMGLPNTGPCQPADRRTWRASQALADQFWNRWVREYLPTLVARGNSKTKDRPLKIGDLVIVVDPSLPRNTWPRGIVEKVYPGPDGEIRNADVRTQGGVFRRPTRKLAVLPVQEGYD